MNIIVTCQVKVPSPGLARPLRDGIKGILEDYFGQPYGLEVKRVICPDFAHDPLNDPLDVE